MNENEAQPDSGDQEVESNAVAQKLGLMDERGLSDLLKSTFLNEEETAPVTQEQELEEVADSSGEDDQLTEDDSEPHESSSLTKGVQKRINKLVAAKKAAQSELEAQKAQLAQLQQELESAKASVPVKQQDQTDFAEGLNTFDQVKAEYDKAVEVLLWCEDNSDGGVITLPDGTEHELSDKEVRAMKRTALKRKEIELPARLNYLQQQQQSDAQVKADFPWWGKPETEEYQVAQQIIRDFPELKKRRADWKHLASLVVLGAKAYSESKAKAKAQSQPIRRAPVQPGVTKAPPARTSGSEETKAKQQFAKTGGSRDGLTDLVKAMNFV
jgi:soluble cytochrome b562